MYQKMKGNIFIPTLICMALMSAVSCWKAEFPHEASSRPEVKEFSAVAGDAEITLEWTPYEDYVPDHYIITYNDVNQDLQTITTNETSYVIDNLENDFEYLIGLQAVYAGNVISNKVSAAATPRTTRFPITVFVVESGNASVTLKWEKPHEAVMGYELTYWIEGEESKKVQIDKDKEEYVLSGLQNVKIYHITLCGVYQKGLSSPVSAVAMPCEFPPYSIGSERLIVGKPVKFTFNTKDYPSATDIEWDFSGDKVQGAEVSYTFWSVSKPEVKVSVMLDGSPVTWPVLITSDVEEFVFDFSDYSASGVPNNGFYSSAPVFSPDGKTAYQITTKNTTLYAIDIEKGTMKWAYPTAESSRFTASVNPVTGDIMFGTAVSGGYYCVTPEGQLKWKASTDAGFSECGPAAINKTGTVVYVADAIGTIYAFDTNDGHQIWKKETNGGLSGGVLVSGEDILYGNNSLVYFLNASDGNIIKEIDQQMWKTTGFAVSPDRRYAYLSCKNGGSLAQCIARIDLQKREQDKVLTVGADNTWGIAISPDGTLFAANKDGNAYCLEADLSAVRWSYGHTDISGAVLTSSFNFSHPVADNDGNFLITSTGNDKKNMSKTYWFEGATGNLKDSWSYSKDVLGDGYTYSHQAGNNLIDGNFFCCYNSAGTNAGPFLCKYIGAERAKTGWASIGGDIHNSNCIK